MFNCIDFLILTNMFSNTEFVRTCLHINLDTFNKNDYKPAKKVKYKIASKCIPQLFRKYLFWDFKTRIKNIEIINVLILKTNVAISNIVIFTVSI